MSSKKVVVGAVLGGLVAGIAAVMLSKNKNCKSSISEYGEKLQDFMQDLQSNIPESTECFTEKAQEIIETVKNEVVSDLDSKDFRKGIVVGAVLGGLLGAKGASLKANNSTHPVAKTVNDLMDFAVSGMAIWKNLQKKF